MEHQFFIRQQNLKLYRSLVAASEAAAAKADARQEKFLKLLAEEVANNRRPERTKALDAGMSRLTCQQIVFVTKPVLSVNRSAVCGLGSTPSRLATWTDQLLSTT